jgi:hypothetical protein
MRAASLPIRKKIWSPRWRFHRVSRQGVTSDLSPECASKADVCIAE